MRWIGLCLGVCACSNRVVATDEDDGGDSGGRPTSSGEGESEAEGEGEGESEGEGEGEGEGEAEVDEGMTREDQEALLAVATFLSPSTPLQWHMLADWEDGELVEVRLQSLSLDIGSATMPRQLVGESFVVETAVDDVGSIGIRIGDLYVPGEANPITGSPIIASDVRMIGTMDADGSACGTVTGMVIMPIETALDGSTFAITPIESLDALPELVVGGC